MTAIKPPVSKDTDLRDFRFMPLDAQRLRDSDLAAYATAEEFRAAILLWCAAWHQLPASSVPDDDRVLAHFAGFGRNVDEWMKVREGALRNFKKATDGRLYHTVVAEKAAQAWSEKISYRNRKERRTEIARKAAEDRWKKTEEFKEDVRFSIGELNSEQCMEDASCITNDMLKEKGTGTGIGTETGTINNTLHQTSSEPEPHPCPDEEEIAKPSLKYTIEFEAWWSVYPRKKGKAAALEAYKVAKKKIGHQAHEKLMDAVKAFAIARKGDDPKFIPHPTTWLSQGRWDDDIGVPAGSMPHMVGRNRFGVGG